MSQSDPGYHIVKMHSLTTNRSHHKHIRTLAGPPGLYSLSGRTVGRRGMELLAHRDPED